MNPEALQIVREYDHTDYLRHPAYEQYMRMHKVLVGERGSQQLEEIYQSLSQEDAPEYLIAAGWAAAEAGVARRTAGVGERLSLLDAAVTTWQRAYENQMAAKNALPSDAVEYGTGHRIALDIACAPLLAGVVQGDVSSQTVRRVFSNCLDIAVSNIEQLQLMTQMGNKEAIASYVGVGHECNALLAFNRTLSKTWFALPATARSDTGYHHREQTHDLVIFHQNYGTIRSLTPVEIKSHASLRDRQRYDALLVRGKMHLSVPGSHSPVHMLAAIRAATDGTATERESTYADDATNRLTAMVRDYYAGKILGKTAGMHTVTVFHDNAQVVANHPGLSRVALAS